MYVVSPLAISPTFEITRKPRKLSGIQHSSERLISRRLEVSVTESIRVRGSQLMAL